MNRLKRFVRTIRDYYVIKKSGCFDERYYLENYPDVRHQGVNPLIHYLLHGVYEGRNPSKSFDTNGYLECHDDINLSDINPLYHYVVRGKKAGRVSSSIREFTQSKILTNRSGDKTYEIISRSSYFDSDWYKTKYLKHSSGLVDPINHYITEGVYLGYDPSEKFSTSRYLDTYRDVKSAKVNPLYHFLLHGSKEGRNPKPNVRKKALGLTRFTPEESGDPDHVLEFDSPRKIRTSLNNESIVVHLHLFHQSMAEEVSFYLNNIRHDFVLLVSIAELEDVDYWTDYFSSKIEHASSVIVKSVTNRGRDVLPWVVEFKDEIKKHTIFCHLHTKRSDHNKSHSGWFRFLSHTILGSKSVVDQILEIFSKDRRVGLIFPAYFWSLANQPNYGQNRKGCEELYRRITNEEIPNICPDYPAGSFFWSRTSALEPLFNLSLSYQDFPEELGQTEGTTAHAIERLIGLLPKVSGMKSHMVTVDVAYDLTRYIHPNRKNLSESIRRTVACHPGPTVSEVKQPRKFKPKVALFTCLAGNYEAASSLITNKDGIDCFLFTDDESITSPYGYEVRQSNYINPQPVRTARFVKTHPHVWFKDYDYAVWIDSNIHFFGDLFEYIDILEKSDADCAFIKHPVRDTALEEYHELLNCGIIDKDLGARQMAHYLQNDENIRMPLMETNFYICKPNSKNIKKMMGYWWADINRFTHRDQLSIGAAMFRSGVKWISLLEDGRSAREHPDFVLFDHRYKNRENVIQYIQNCGEK